MSTPNRLFDIARENVIARNYVLVQTINKQKYYYDRRGGWTLQVGEAKQWDIYPDSTTLGNVSFYGCCEPVVIEEVAG